MNYDKIIEAALSSGAGMLGKFVRLWLMALFGASFAISLPMTLFSVSNHMNGVPGPELLLALFFGLLIPLAIPVAVVTAIAVIAIKL